MRASCFLSGGRENNHAISFQIEAVFSLPSSLTQSDVVAEWLLRMTRNHIPSGAGELTSAIPPLGRRQLIHNRGSNPLNVDNFLAFRQRGVWIRILLQNGTIG